MLKRDEILSKTKLKTEKISVEEWGGEVIISSMSGTMRDSWEQMLREKDSDGKIISPRAKLVAFTVVDEKGERVFTDKDVVSIGKLSSSSLDKVTNVAMRLNGLSEDAVEDAKKNLS
jgi:hypothetical protein